MATVRMTKTLKQEILSAIDAKYNTVIDSYKPSKDIIDRATELAHKAIEEDVVKVKEIESELQGLLDRHTRYIKDVSADLFASRIFNRHYGYIPVTLSEKEDTVNLLSFNMPLDRYEKSNSYVYTTTGIGNRIRLEDEDLIKLVKPLRTEANSINNARYEIKQHIREIMITTTTLKQLLDVVPKVVEFVPSYAISARNSKEKRYAPKKEKETIDETMANSLSKSLDEVSTHADAIKILGE
jgi:hypothetical protein